MEEGICGVSTGDRRSLAEKYKKEDYPASVLATGDPSLRNAKVGLCGVSAGDWRSLTSFGIVDVT
jgi:hypothetical protein